MSQQAYPRTTGRRGRLASGESAWQHFLADRPELAEAQPDVTPEGLMAEAVAVGADGTARPDQPRGAPGRRRPLVPAVRIWVPYLTTLGFTPATMPTTCPDALPSGLRWRAETPVRSEGRVEPLEQLGQSLASVWQETVRANTRLDAQEDWHRAAAHRIQQISDELIAERTRIDRYESGSPAADVDSAAGRQVADTAATRIAALEEQLAAFRTSTEQLLGRLTENVGHLTAEVSRLTSEQSAQAAKMSSLYDRDEWLRGATKELADQVQDHAVEIGAYDERSRIYQERLDDHDQRLTDHSGRLVNHAERLSTYREQLADHRRRLVSRGEQLSQQAARIAAYDQRIAEQTAAVETLRTQQDEITTVNAELVSKGANQDERLASHQDRLTDQGQQLAEQSTAVENLTAGQAEAVEALQTTRAESVRGVAEVHQAMADHKRQLAGQVEAVETLKAAQTETTADVADLRQTTAGQVTAVEAMKAAQAKAAAGVAELTDTLTQRLQGHDELLTEHAGTVEALRTDHTQAVGESAERIEALAQRVTELAERAGDLAQQIDQHAAAVEAARDEQRQLVTGHADRLGEHDELLGRIQADHAIESERLLGLGRVIKKHGDRVAELEVDHDELAAEFDAAMTLRNLVGVGEGASDDGTAPSEEIAAAEVEPVPDQHVTAQWVEVQAGGTARLDLEVADAEPVGATDSDALPAATGEDHESAGGDRYHEEPTGLNPEPVTADERSDQDAVEVPATEPVATEPPAAQDDKHESDDDSDGPAAATTEQKTPGPRTPAPAPEENGGQEKADTRRRGKRRREVDNGLSWLLGR